MFFDSKLNISIHTFTRQMDKAPLPLFTTVIFLIFSLEALFYDQFRNDKISRNSSKQNIWTNVLFMFHSPLNNKLTHV